MINANYVKNEIDYSINNNVNALATNATIVCRACKHGYKPNYIIDNESVSADANTDRVGFIVKNCT